MAMSRGGGGLLVDLSSNAHIISSFHPSKSTLCAFAESGYGTGGVI